MLSETVTLAQEPEFGPWNPGIESTLPRRLLPLATLFRPENAFTGLEHAEELRDLTGLELWELVALRPQRLVLHELLVRVTADLSVPDGAKVEDLGINFRAMTSAILAGYIAPHMAEIEEAYRALRGELGAIIEAELREAFAAPPFAPWCARFPPCAPGTGAGGATRRCSPRSPPTSHATSTAASRSGA